MLTDIQWAYVHDANKMAFIMTRIKGQDSMQEGTEPKERAGKVVSSVQLNRAPVTEPCGSVEHDQTTKQRMGKSLIPRTACNSWSQNWISSACSSKHDCWIIIMVYFPTFSEEATSENETKHVKHIYDLYVAWDSVRVVKDTSPKIPVFHYL